MKQAGIYVNDVFCGVRLFVIVFCQQKTVDSCKEIALEDTVLLTEGIHLRHIHTQRPHH